MTQAPAIHSFGSHPRAPAHLWVVGILLVLWNGWGLALAIAAQTNRLPYIDATSSAFFSSQPLWVVLLGDLGPIAGIAGAVALLLQSRTAVWLFMSQFAILALTNSYEVAAGTSLLLSVAEARAATVFVLATFAFQLGYAWLLKRRGILG